MRTSRLRPAQPGVSIGHYKISAGTFGALVKDKETGDLLILSNNHVLANITNGVDDRARKGDPILQPGSYDNGNKPDDVIGYLERFIPLKWSSGSGNVCPVAAAGEKILNFILHLFKPSYNIRFTKSSGANIVDCAVARPANEKAVSGKILEIGEVKGVKEPSVGMRVLKSGRTSGLTQGEVKVVSATVQVKMTETEQATFEDQFITEPMSKPGDSGSLVVDRNNNAVGLLFAGSEKATVCNRITNVLDSLNIEF